MNGIYPNAAIQVIRLQQFRSTDTIKIIEFLVTFVGLTHIWLGQYYPYKEVLPFGNMPIYNAILDDGIGGTDSRRGICMLNSINCLADMNNFSLHQTDTMVLINAYKKHHLRNITSRIYKLIKRVFCYHCDGLTHGGIGELVWICIIWLIM